jgi:hypothetical protein
MHCRQVLSQKTLYFLFLLNFLYVFPSSRINKSIIYGDREYFPFVVSHSKLSESYNLACLTDRDREEWISVIESVSGATAQVSKTGSAKDIRTSLTSADANEQQIQVSGKNSSKDSFSTSETASVAASMRWTAQGSILFVYLVFLYNFFPK